MKVGKNNIIGVGLWVERSNGNWYQVNPRDPWSWFLYPILTLQELFA